MASISEFLEARIAEDEVAAYDLMGEREGDRVLAECASKRLVIELAKKASEDEKEYDDYEWQGTVKRSEPLTGDAILFALAAVYKDHPGYQQEWARG